MNTALDNMNFVADQVAKTVTSTALSLTDLGFTAAQVKRARAALISVETTGVRYRFGTPTAANGHLVNAGDGGWIQGRKALALLKFIRATGSDSTLTVSLFE